MVLNDHGQESYIVAGILALDGATVPGKSIYNNFYTSYNGRQIVHEDNTDFEVGQKKKNSGALLLKYWRRDEMAAILLTTISNQTIS